MIIENKNKTEYVRQNLHLKSKKKHTALIKLEETIWKKPCYFMADPYKLWLPINLPQPSRSSLLVYDDFTFLGECYWYRNPSDDVPEYYWIEYKDGIGKCNYLPIDISKMLKTFKNIYGHPSTRGVVFDIKVDCFSFKDTKWNHTWELYETKIVKVLADKSKKEWEYNRVLKEFTFLNS